MKAVAGAGTMGPVPMLLARGARQGGLEPGARSTRRGFEIARGNQSVTAGPQECTTPTPQAIMASYAPVLFVYPSHLSNQFDGSRRRTSPDGALSSPEVTILPSTLLAACASMVKVRFHQRRRLGASR